MTRDSTLFNIRYSFQIEAMHATLYNRVDKFLTFAQIILGSAIFADYGSLPIFGALVAVISIGSFIWQPGKAAILHEIQSKKMKLLVSKPSSVSDEELHSDYLIAQETDNSMLGLLRDAAHKRTLISFGRFTEANEIKLSLIEKIVAWLSGDLPKDN